MLLIAASTVCVAGNGTTRDRRWSGSAAVVASPKCGRADNAIEDVVIAGADDDGEHANRIGHRRQREP